MTTLDYVVLIGYFLLMAGIGVVCMFRIKEQEDYFMGGRSFGKLLQTFAAFGAGTGANDPVTVGRTTWTSGLAGIWGVLMWLFVTPFYWIFGVWYRRMRHITIGDWYTERYDSKGLGAAYCVFGIVFYMLYLSTMFTAIAKVAGPIMGDSVAVWGLKDPVPVQYVLIPTISLVVVVYGILGGLRAAYWTDLIQGIGIILLSVILIPTGLQRLIEAFPDSATSSDGIMRGFEIMHSRMPDDYFKIFGGPKSSEFPLHYIVSLSLLSLIGIVVQPHFISTGGGSAKTENSARVGLVAGNFLKRFCTLGWALTGLIILCLFASDPRLASDPDRVWGVASVELLKPGFVGLMLACLLAALMSSADAYMIMVAGLVTRNIFRPLAPHASEKTYLTVARCAGLIMIAGAAVVSLYFMNVFGQLLLALKLPMVFASSFWLGMWWRRATKWGAWLTIVISLTVFFIIPMVPKLAPNYTPGFMNDSRFAIKTYTVTTTIIRPSRDVDLARREGWRKRYDELMAMEDTAKAFSGLSDLGTPSLVPVEAEEAHRKWVGDFKGIIGKASKAITEVKSTGATGETLKTTIDPLYADAINSLKALGPPQPLGDLGAEIKEEYKSGGQPVYWDKVVPVGSTPTTFEEVSKTVSPDGKRVELVQREVGAFKGEGVFNLDMTLYQLIGVNMESMDSGMLATLDLPVKLVGPFVTLIVLSLITPRTRKEALDRYYIKMKVPVLEDHTADQEQLDEAYQHPEAFEDKKIFPNSSIEIQRPRWSDAIGFVACFGICFLIVWLAVWMANLGAK